MAHRGIVSPSVYRVGGLVIHKKHRQKNIHTVKGNTMHTVQLMLIEADADATAAGVQAEVDSLLAEVNGEWFDWYGEGAFGKGLAGRWTEDYIKDDVLRYSDNPTRADELIEEFTKYRLDHLAEAQKRIADFDIRTAEYNEQRDLMEPFYANRVAQILNGFWTSDSGLYDLTAYSTFTRYFRDRVKTDPTKQYLVVVDFHF